MNLIMDCTSRLVTKEAQSLLGNNFCPGNVTMSVPIELDDYEAVSALENDAKSYMSSPEWGKVRSWVKDNWK